MHVQTGVTQQGGSTIATFSRPFDTTFQGAGPHPMLAAGGAGDLAQHAGAHTLTPRAAPLVTAL